MTEDQKDTLRAALKVLIDTDNLATAARVRDILDAEESGLAEKLRLKAQYERNR